MFKIEGQMKETIKNLTKKEESIKSHLKRKREEETFTKSKSIKVEPLDNITSLESKYSSSDLNKGFIEPIEFINIKQETNEEEVHPTKIEQIFLDEVKKEVKAETDKDLFEDNNFVAAGGDWPEHDVGFGDKSSVAGAMNSLTPLERKKMELDKFMRDLVSDPLECEARPPTRPIKKPTLTLVEVVNIVESGKVCPECSREFTPADRLADHLFWHHLITDNHPTERAKCPFTGCPLAFPRPTELRAHFNRCHKPQKLILSAARCKREGCGFDNRVLGLLCSKEHLYPDKVTTSLLN